MEEPAGLAATCQYPKKSKEADADALASESMGRYCKSGAAERRPDAPFSSVQRQNPVCKPKRGRTESPFLRET